MPTQLPAQLPAQMPAPIPNCPPGLEHLTTLSQLLVKQKTNLLEVMTGYEKQNKYVIKNNLGQNVSFIYFFEIINLFLYSQLRYLFLKQIFWAAEYSEVSARCCCGADRDFDMSIEDVYNREVMYFSCPHRCSLCRCSSTCRRSIYVSSPPGQFIGCVDEEYSFCIPTYTVKDQYNETVLRIEGHECASMCFGGIDFSVRNIFYLV